MGLLTPLPKMLLNCPSESSSCTCHTLLAFERAKRSKGDIERSIGQHIIGQVTGNRKLRGYNGLGVLEESGVQAVVSSCGQTAISPYWPE